MSESIRALDAARAVCAGLGLPVAQVSILQEANRLTLRLRPADIVARVGRGEHAAARLEVELAQALADAGCPVGRVDSRADPRVYVQDGFAVTLWEPLDRVASAATAREYADALVRLHAGMRTVATPVPRFTARVAAALDVVGSPALSPELGDGDREFLRGRLIHLGRAIRDRGTEQLLHGEPHPGNVIATAAGARFIDLETVCRGPVEFDVAHVPAEVAELYPGLDRSLRDDCRELVLAMVAAWRWERGDRFPNGPQVRQELMDVLRSGAPWPTLDALRSAE